MPSDTASAPGSDDERKLGVGTTTSERRNATGYRVAWWLLRKGVKKPLEPN
jgi:hypothetical protein